MSARAHDHMARQTRAFVQRMIDTHGKAARLAIVRDLEPPDGDGLQAELVEGGVQLNDDDLLLTEHVQEYDDRVGIKIGNSLLVVEVGKDFVVLGVMSEDDPPLAEDSGRAVFSGNAAQTVFVIPHDLGAVPSVVHVTPGSIAARVLLHVTASSSAVTVTFGTAPASGTNNVALYWSVKR